MKLKQTIKLALLGILFGVASSVSATNYYSKITAVPSANGKVYASTSKSDPGSNYTDKASSQTTKSDSQSHTYYLYAQANTGYQFDGWYSDESCTSIASEDNPYTATITATSTEQSSPTSATYYAKFSEVLPPTYSTLTAHSASENCTVSVTTDKSAKPTYSSEKSANISNTKAIHYYYLYATVGDLDLDFAGWYSDAACTQLVSYLKEFTYEANNLSSDSSNPTTINLYAKFVEPSKYQMRNSNFENWETVSKSEEPLQWSSFYDNTGNMASLAQGLQIEKSTDAKSGNYSAHIYGRSIAGIATAQGNLTNGCINAGSMSAEDASGNYNYVGDPSNTRTDQNMKFSGRPDAVKFWCKFSGNDNYGNASILLLTDGFYQDPYYKQSGKTEATKIAHAKNGTIASTNTWNEITIPFEYYTTDIPTQILTTFSTCATPGAGKASDKMWIDDVRMIYNSELESVTYNDANITLTGNSATIDDVYTDSKLVLTSNGKGASIEKSYDNATGVLTITVKGDNISEDASNYHEYTLKFTPKTGTTKTYNKYVGVVVNGAMTAPVAAPIEVTYYEDNTIDFNLENFCLGEIGVGNITLPGLAYSTTDGTFSYNGNLNITAGDKEGIGYWLGPTLGDIPLNLQGIIKDDYFYVTIGIDMTGTTLGQMIDVEVGDLATANVSISDALVSTFCAPFKVSIAAALPAAAASLADYITASTVTAADKSGVLTLSKINGIIPAHTPIIIEANQAIKSYMPVTLPVSGIYSQGTPEAGMLVGTYEATNAPADSYILQNQSGVVGFYHVSTSHTVKANRCWLVAPESGVKAFIIRNDEAEGINAQTIENKQQTIFNLQGQRVNNVQKGVNIVNGKKIIR